MFQKQSYAIVVLFVLAVLFGLLCASLAYGGAFLIIIGFSWASITAWYLNIKSIVGKLIGVVTIDAGLIIGCYVRSSYWRSLHGFDSLWNWSSSASIVMLAILVSGAAWVLPCLIERIWPTPSDETSE